MQAKSVDVNEYMARVENNKIIVSVPWSPLIHGCLSIARLLNRNVYMVAMAMMVFAQTSFAGNIDLLSLTMCVFSLSVCRGLTIFTASAVPFLWFTNINSQHTTSHCRLSTQCAREINSCCMCAV